MKYNSSGVACVCCRRRRCHYYDVLFFSSFLNWERASSAETFQFSSTVPLLIGSQRRLVYGYAMESAIPLLQQHGENIVVNEEACKHLASIKENLVIVACTGMYRTGKSFLLNSLAQVEKPVFNVGNTTDACTKGIWIYDTKKILENGGRLIYFDSEGLASLDQDENYDAKIFSLSLLLSSYFILNTMGVIDEGAIDRLFLVSELSKRILIEKNQVENENVTGKDGKDTKNTSDNSNKLARYFPRILFACEILFFL